MMWQVMLDPTTPATAPLPWLWQAENEARALRAEHLPAVVLFVPASSCGKCGREFGNDLELKEVIEDDDGSVWIRVHCTCDNDWCVRREEVEAWRE